MAKNEIIAPNGPTNKMSLPAGSADTVAALKAGSPVVCGVLCGVTQTDLESVDGGATGIVNSNAPGNVTVWNGGVWRLPVKTETTAGKIGDQVYAVKTADKIQVTLVTKSAAGAVPFGVLREPNAVGTANVAVQVFEYAGPAAS